MNFTCPGGVSSIMEEKHYFVSRYHRCLNYRHRLSDELYLTMCGMEQCSPGKSRGPEQRPGYHLHVIFSGEGVFESCGRRISLHAGQLFLVKPMETTYYRASLEKPWSYCWVTFDGQKAAYYMEQAGFTQGVNALMNYVEPDRFHTLASQILSQPELTLSNDLRRQGLLHEFIGLAVESCYRARHGRHNPTYSTGSYVDQALDYMNHNFAHMKISDISGFIGIDRSYFSNIFRKRTGVSPQTYLIHIRMRRGGELLRTTEHSVKEIARMVGYENALTFSKIFKNFYGVSPKHYRLQPEEERVYLPEMELPGRDDTD